MIFIYGNCQVGFLFNILLLSKEFRDKYKLSCPYIKSNKILDDIINDSYVRIVNFKSIKNNKNLLKVLNFKYDLAILQYTDKKHGLCSTDYIKDKINCDNIIILPFIVNHGFLPITREGSLNSQMYKKNGKIYELENGSMGSQEIIDLFYKFDLKTVLNMLKNIEIQFNLEERYNKSIKILKEKEFHCNISVSDILLKNKNIRLFHQNVHTTGYLLQMISNIILKKNDMNSITVYDINYEKTLELDIKYGIQGTTPPPSSPYEIKIFNHNYYSVDWFKYYSNKITEIYKGFQKNK